MDSGAGKRARAGECAEDDDVRTLGGQAGAHEEGGSIVTEAMAIFTQFGFRGRRIGERRLEMKSHISDSRTRPVGRTSRLTLVVPPSLVLPVIMATDAASEMVSVAVPPLIVLVHL